MQAEPGDPVALPGTSDMATDEVVDVPTHLTDEERRLLDWHWANLEYGCSARLNQVHQPQPNCCCVSLAVHKSQIFCQNRNLLAFHMN